LWKKIGIEMFSGPQKGTSLHEIMSPDIDHQNWCRVLGCTASPTPSTKKNN